MKDSSCTYFGYPEPSGCRILAIRITIAIVILLAMLVAMFSLSGCKATQPVQFSHNRDSARIEKIYVLDSIYIDRWHTILQKGDIIYKHDSIVQNLWHVKEVHDTLTVVSADTVTIREEIEKPLSGGSKFLLWSGAALWILVGALIIAGVVAIVLHIRRR